MLGSNLPALSGIDSLQYIVPAQNLLTTSLVATIKFSSVQTSQVLEQSTMWGDHKYGSSAEMCDMLAIVFKEFANRNMTWEHE